MSQDETRSSSTREQIELYIKPALQLGEALCVNAEQIQNGAQNGTQNGAQSRVERESDSPRHNNPPEIKLKQRLTPSQSRTLERAIDHPDGAELWLWVRE